MKRIVRMVFVTAAAVVAWGGMAGADEKQAKTLKTEPLAARWEFSTDNGATFAAAMPAEINPGTVKTIVARGTFAVEDPAAIACLWLGMENASNDNDVSEGGFCLGDAETAGGRECGVNPLWQNARVEVNGKSPAGPLAGMTYRQMPIGGDVLVKGQNTLTVSGNPWRINSPSSVTLKPLRLTRAAPQPAEIGVGPVLGMVGPDFFTVSLRTRIPAAVTVSAKAGSEVTGASSPVGFYHQLKVPLAKGVRTFTYTVVSKVGGAEVSAGPFEARRPAFDGDSLRFAAMGNTRCNYYADMNAPKLVQGIVKSGAELFVNAGQVVELASWDFMWEHMATYLPLSTVLPTYVSPAAEDHVGMFYKMWATPAGEAELQNWTQGIGPVRLIGLDGVHDWSAGSANAQWLETVLSGAKEKFIFAFNHYPGYSSGTQSRPRSAGAPMWAPLQQCRDVINPLLAKHRVAALISAFEYNYERCEVTPPQGVPAIIVGGGGTKVYRLSNRGSANNPFAGKGVFLQANSFAVFDVKGDTCEMTVISIDGSELDKRSFQAR